MSSPSPSPAFSFSFSSSPSALTPINDENIFELDKIALDKQALENGALDNGVENTSDIITNPHDDAPAGTVKRGLKPRHVAMMALGGTIGTGLFVGTQKALADAGPVGSLLAYLFMASIVYSIAQSVGEMCTYIPITGSFTVFVSRFLSPALGAAVGWLYWFSWATTFAIELSVIGHILTSLTGKLPIYVWISIFLVLLTGINFFPVKICGEIEFWSACLKVTALIAWLIYAFTMIVGGGSLGFVGFKYWINPGVMGPGVIVENVHAGRFLGFLSALVNAAFTFQGVELVGVSAGEASNPRRTIPRAINRTFFRILVFYIGSIFFLGLLIPYNHPLLTLQKQSSPLCSPFVIAMMNSGTEIFPHIFNGVILCTIISAGNSNIYIGSRLLYALGSAKIGPHFLTYTNRYGVPIWGVVGTASMGLLSFMAISKGSMVFTWLLNIGAVAGLICWASISLSHLQFMRCLQYNGLTRVHNLPYVASGGRLYVWYAIVGLFGILIFQGLPSYFEWSLHRFLTAHISIVIFFALWGVFQALLRTPLYVKLEDMDIFSGSREIEELEDVKPKGFWGKLVDQLF